MKLKQNNKGLLQSKELMEAFDYIYEHLYEFCIYLHFSEINEESVVFHWKYNLDDIDVSEEIIVDILPIKKSS